MASLQKRKAIQKSKKGSCQKGIWKLHLIRERL